jgi:hypothetical protein
MSSNPENPRSEGEGDDAPNMLDWLGLELDQPDTADEGDASTGGEGVVGDGGQQSDPDWRDGSDGVGYPQDTPDDGPAGDLDDAADDAAADTQDASAERNAADYWGSEKTSPQSEPAQSWIQRLSESELGDDASDRPEPETAEPVGEDQGNDSDTGSGDDDLATPIALADRRKNTSPFLDGDIYDSPDDADRTSRGKRARHSRARGAGSKTAVLSGRRGWVLVGAGAAVLVVLAAVVGTRLMADDEPVSDQRADSAQTSVPGESAPDDQAVGARQRGDAPGQQVSSREDTIGGNCGEVEDSDAEVVKAGQRDPRAAWVTYNSEMYAHNTEGIQTVLAGDSALKKQDWGKVMDATPEGASFCLQMEPTSGSTVRGELTVNTEDGEETVYKQIATVAEVDGRWFIQDIKKDNA